MKKRTAENMANEDNVAFIVTLLDKTKEAYKYKNNFICIEHIIGSLEHNFSENNIQISEMARQLGMTERTLRRRCTVIFNLTPVELLNYYRVYKAKNLLNSKMSLAEVGDATGFNSQSYFTQVFKQISGMTPQEYRDGCRAKCSDMTVDCPNIDTNNKKKD